MPEANKDPSIKLFGRTISVSRHNTEVSDNDSPYDDDHSTLSPSSSDPRELSYGIQHEAEMDKVIVGAKSAKLDPVHSRIFKLKNKE